MNKQIPSNPEVLSKALGLSVNEVSAFLPNVMSFFAKVCEFIVCPEMENYRKHLETRTNKISKSGKKGADS